MKETVPPGNAGLQPGSTETAKNATLEIGDPGENANLQSADSRWHSRGYMPHFESTAVIQHVTYHLADSLPQAVVAQLDQELQQMPLAQQPVERRKRINAWIDAGYGSCVLREPAIATMVQNTFLHFDGQRYRLLAWVVMPNHVHVLFQPLPGWTMAKIVASWKSFTGRRISEWLKTNPGPAKLPSGLSAAPRLEPGEPRVWHREYWDRFMRNEEHFAQAVIYIHQNPVKAGLAVNAQDWQWSSAFPGNARLQSGGPSTGGES